MLVGNGHLMLFSFMLFLFSPRWVSVLYHLIILQIQESIFGQCVLVEMMSICICGLLNVTIACYFRLFHPM